MYKISSLFVFLFSLQCNLVSVSGNALLNRDSSISNYDVTSFEVRDLQAGKRLEELSRVLSDTGMIAITDNPISHLQSTRKEAFTGMCSCLSASSGRHRTVRGIDSALLADGTTRTTLATATVGETPLDFNHAQLQDDAGCDAATVQAMEALRDHVAVASHAFVQALDQLLWQENNATRQVLLDTLHGQQYETVQSIVQASHNLEHFHVYEKENRNEDSSTTDVLQPHTDAGLFLAFVPGMSCTDPESTNSNLYVNQQLAVFPPGSVGIMLGVGSEHWLRTPLSVPLRATRHAVSMEPGQKRAWYGTMHLVPQDAIIQDVPQRTFRDMRKAMAHSKSRKFGDSQEHGDEDILSIGCGSSSTSERVSGSTRINRRRLGTVDDASFCNNVTSFFCWSSCLDIPNHEEAAEKIGKGQSLYCLDPATLHRTGNMSTAVDECSSRGVVGDNHNHACFGSWQATADGVTSQQVSVDQAAIAAASQQFCYGGTSMYMDGFHWTDPTCVIYLFPSWVLSSRGALWGASIGTLAFGMVIEGAIKYRRILVQAATPGWRRLGVSSIMYGLQLTLGYLIMLVVMTYSAPLFMCVVLGFVGGHVFFNFDQVQNAAKEKEGKSEKGCCGTSPDSEESVSEEGGCCGKSSSSEVKADDICLPEGATPCCQNVL